MGIQGVAAEPAGEPFAAAGLIPPPSGDGKPAPTMMATLRQVFVLQAAQQAEQVFLTSYFFFFFFGTPLLALVGQARVRRKAQGLPTLCSPVHHCPPPPSSPPPGGKGKGGPRLV